MLISHFTIAKNNKIKLNGIQLNIPATFDILTDDEIIKKHLSMHKPLGYYSNETRKVDVSISEAQSKWVEKDIELMHSFLVATIQNLYDEVEMIQDTIMLINNRKFVVLEFIGRLRFDQNAIVNKSGLSRYYKIAYAIKKNKTFVVNFNCPARDISNWQNTATEIIESIEIK